MGERRPDVHDYTAAEWRHRDTRREAAYECARLMGFTRENARKCAQQVAEHEPGAAADQPPQQAGRRSSHVSRSGQSAGGGSACLPGRDPAFPWVKLPGAD